VITIGDRQIDADSPPYIIAELGVNHDGAVDRALQLVDAANDAGADAIKLQYFETDRLLSAAAKLASYQENAGATDPHDMLRELELTIDQMGTIVAHAHDQSLHAIVTVFSVELVEQADALPWDAYKVASPDIINRPLIESLMATGKPLVLSTGAATLDEIREATAWLGDHPHLLMQCVSAYPTPDEDAALNARLAIKSVNPNALGYSDHTQSIDTGALAIASGARVLERHLTYDQSAPGPDHEASLDPDQFAAFVRLAHRAFAMCGPREKTVGVIEQDVRAVSRQSLTTTQSVPSGHAIARDDLTIKRPGTGLSPALLDEVIGRVTAHPLDADTPITESDLA